MIIHDNLVSLFKHSVTLILNLKLICLNIEEDW